MNRYLKYLSLLWVGVLFFSCSPAITPGSATVPEIITTSGTTQKYNLQLDFRKNHFSGMLIARRMDNGDIRLLFNTHFGLSVFDFTLNPDTMIVNNLVEPMRNKRLLKLLEKDFRLLFLPTRPARVKEKSAIFEKRISGRGFGKAVVTINRMENAQLQRIAIRHPWIKLTIEINEMILDH